MRLLLIGRTGQVALELLRRAPAGVEVTALGREACDLANPAEAAEAVLQAQADAVVNAAAWTAVDRAEAEEALARAVNAEAPFAMALACARRGLPFVHISTDYVFPGDGTRPFRPDDPTGPLNAYGRTKLEGEEGVRRAHPAAHAILRTSWVFSPHGANFVKTMRRLGRERPEIAVVDDQHGGPTPASAIADACLALARGLLDGAPAATHHLAGAPDTTWAGFARAVMEEAGLPARIRPVASADFPTPARRPLNSRLDCASLTAATGLPRPDWRAALRETLRELDA